MKRTEWEAGLSLFSSFGRRRNALGLVILGVVVHLVLLYAVFDIYYKSPVLQVGFV